MISPRALMQADTAALRGVAGQWLDAVEAVDDAAADLGTATQDLPYHWSGDDSLAAQERVTRLRTRIGNAHRRLVSIADAVRGFADEIDDCRRLLRLVVDEAQSERIAVDLDSGTVTAPLRPLDDSGPAQASVDSYVAQITEIIERAMNADTRARELLSATQFRDEESLSDQLGYRDRFDEVDRDAFRNYSPSGMAHVFHYGHPLETERLIEEEPEVYGAADGVPSEQRDRANRILLDRERAALVDQQALLSAATDTPADPMSGPEQHRDLDVVDERLAAIDRLQARLDDPDQPKLYLVDYRPGQETTTRLTPADPTWDDPAVGAKG